MGAWENEFQFSQNYISYEIYRDLPVFSQFLGNLTFISRTPRRNFLWCHYRWLITSLGPKNVKKNAIFFKLFWYKVFVHWELKLLNFLVDCVLIFIVFTSFKRLLCQDVPIDQYTFDGVYQWSLTSFLLAPEEVETSFNPSIWIFQFLIFLIFFMC